MIPKIFWFVFKISWKYRGVLRKHRGLFWEKLGSYFWKYKCVFEKHILEFSWNSHLRLQKYRRNFSQNTLVYFQSTPLYFENTSVFSKYTAVFRSNLKNESKIFCYQFLWKFMKKVKIHPCILKSASLFSKYMHVLWKYTRVFSKYIHVF